MTSTNRKEYVISYSETYQKVYTVEANSAEEAKAILYQKIGEGSENGPEECVDSSMAVLQPFYFTFGSNEAFPYQNGYLVVYAGCRSDAIKAFRQKYPDREPDCINCAFIYSKDEWKQTKMCSLGSFPCYETLYADSDSESTPEDTPREFFIDTPLGKIKVYAKTNADDPSDFPGVYVDLVKEDELIQLACVEYESVYKKLQTCVYGDGLDDAPTVVVTHTNL